MLEQKHREQKLKIRLCTEEWLCCSIHAAAAFTFVTADGRAVDYEAGRKAVRQAKRAAGLHTGST